MCGDIENEIPLEQRIIERFRDLAEQHVNSGGASGSEASHGYMDTLFGAVLRRCVDDLDEDSGGSVERLRNQAIVLARLSGLLAGQLPPELDTLHATMDAMLVGYGEAGGADAAPHGHDHHH